MGPGTTVTQADMDYDLLHKLEREIEDSHKDEEQPKEEEADGEQS